MAGNPCLPEDDPLEAMSRRLSPKKVVTDEGSVEERPIKEAIEAEQYIAAKEIGNDPLHGLRISRCKPAGPV